MLVKIFEKSRFVSKFSQNLDFGHKNYYLDQSKMNVKTISIVSSPTVRQMDPI